MTGTLKYGVSTYSYVNDYGSIMTLEDAFDHIADTGATGIEIMGEGQVEGYLEPDTAWLDMRFGLLDKYKLEPTNMCSWVDMRLTLSHSLTVEEGAAHDVLNQTFRGTGPTQGYPYFELSPKVRHFEGVGFALYGGAGKTTEPVTQTSQIVAPETPGVSFRSVTSVWLYGYGQFDNTFNSDGRAIGKDIVPSFVPGIAATRQIVSWPDK